MVATEDNDTKPHQAGIPNEEDDDDFSQAGDLSGDGGVVKEIIKKGEGWQRPEAGDDVQMHYKGTLEDGTMFDSSYERGDPFSFKLGDGKVIKGWDVVGKTMTKGEKAKVTLKPEYGYGPQGSPPKIPGNATLIFEMELLGWQSKRDVYGDGLVIKTEVLPGEGWERPSKLAEVNLTVTVTEMSADGKTRGKVLHSGKESFSLGSGEVLAVWDKVVLDMKQGSRVTLICKPPHTSGPRVGYIPASVQCVEYDLTLNSWLKVEDIFSDGTLVKKVLVEGEGWERPKEGSTVTVDLQYSVFDMATRHPRDGEPFLKTEGLEMTLGDGLVVDGLDRAVQSMKSKETAIVTVFPEHAFKTAANLLTPEIAAKGVSDSDGLFVQVTLVKFEKAQDMWSMTFEQKADEMQRRKEKGNELIAAGRIQLAKKSYDRAVAFFDSPTSEFSPELKKRVNQLLVQCHLNLAVCHNRLGDLNKVMEHCKKSLEIAPSNVKALYRRGCAYLALDDYYNAESDFKYALTLSPGNHDVLKKLAELRKKRASQDEKDKKLYSNMFSRLSKLEEKEQSKEGHVKADSEADSKKSVPGKVQGDAKSEPKPSTDVEMKDSEKVEQPAYKAA